MRINTQFPVAVHILAVLAYFGDSVPSEMIAKSIGTNPVVVRRIMSQLKKSGLVDTKSGVKGAILRKEPEYVTLLEIFHAVHSGDEAIFDIHANPNQLCPVGARLSAALSEPLAKAQTAMENELGSATLADILKPIMQNKERGG